MAQSALSESIERLMAPGAEPQPLWLLYDPVLNDPLGLRDRPEVRLPLRLPDHVAIEPELRPGFIQLAADLDDRLFESSVAACEAETQVDALNVGEGRSICGWFRAPRITIDRLRSASVQAQRGAGLRWVRWHDPRVLCQLWPVLKPTQRAGILGAGACGAMVDLLGHVQLIRGAESPAPSRVAEPTSDWDLDAAQWRTLSDTALVISLLARLRADGLVADPTWPLRLHVLLGEARMRGVSQDDDLLAYVCFVVQGHVQGMDFDEALATARLDPGSLGFALKDVLQSRSEAAQADVGE
jgi:hypothetical protein